MRKLLSLVLAALLLLAATCSAEVGMANPWTETDADGLMETLGLALGVPEGATDVSWRMMEEGQMGELTFNTGNMRIDKLNFSIKAETAEGNVLEENQPSTLGTAPLYLVINGDTKGKWFWPIEGMNIGVAYPQFSVWASNLQTSVDWYDSSNASRGIVNY